MHYLSRGKRQRDMLQLLLSLSVKDELWHEGRVNVAEIVVKGGSGNVGLQCLHEVSETR